MGVPALNEMDKRCCFPVRVASVVRTQ